LIITETIVIKPGVVKNLALIDIVEMKDLYFGYIYKYSNIAIQLIILKKLSEYIKEHPNTSLCTQSAGSLIRRIKDQYSEIINLIKSDRERHDQYIAFLESHNVTKKQKTDYIALYCTDIAIQNVERYLDEHR